LFHQPLHRIMNNTVMGNRRQPFISDSSFMLDNNPNWKNKIAMYRCNERAVQQNRQSQIKGSPPLCFLINGSVKDNPSAKFISMNSSRCSGLTKRYALALELYVYICVCIEMGFWETTVVKSSSTPLLLNNWN